LSDRLPAKDPLSVSLSPREGQSAGEDALPTVLLVEDNETDVYVIRSMLRRNRINVNLQVALDGEKALAVLQRLEADRSAPCPRLILLDLNLPRISGLEVLRHIREFTRCGRVPVIVITSSRSATDRAGLAKLNADAHFVKPPDLASYDELAAMVRDIVR
jgi:CheY-like chemotaxis protein